MRTYPRPRLTVQILEARETPADLTASVTGTTLVLTGNEVDNSFGIHRDDTGRVVVTVTAGTIDGTGGTTEGTVFTTTATDITAVRATLGDGHETVTNDTPAVGGGAFSFSGGLTFDVGDGNNVVNLSNQTPGASVVTAKTLTIRQSTGQVVVLVGGGLGPPGDVFGAVNITSTGGPATVTLTDVEITTGLTFTGGTGDDTLTLTRVFGPSALAGPAVTAAGGTGHLAVAVTDSFLGAVSAASPFGVLLRLTQAAADMTTGKVTASAGTGAPAEVIVVGTVETGNISVTGVDARLTDVASTAATLNVTGGVAVSGTALAEVVLNDASSLFTVSKGVTVKSSKGTGRVQNTVPSVGLLVTGGLSVSGKLRTEASVGNARVGSLKVTGGTAADNAVTTATGFETTGTGAVRINTGGGGTVDLTGEVNGRLTVAGKGGADQVTLTGLQVAKAARIVTAGGIDMVRIQAGTSFAKTLFVNQGGGGDFFLLNFDTTTPATYTGKVTVRQAAGDDHIVGSATAAGGNVFVAAGNLFDGGPGNDNRGGNSPSGNPRFIRYEFDPS